MSSLPVPVLALAASSGERSGATDVWSPLSGRPIITCTARASVWSLSSHGGIPTRTAFACNASAMGLLKWGRQAEPMTCTVSTVVNVARAAARAICFASSNIFVTRSGSRSRK